MIYNGENFIGYACNYKEILKFEVYDTAYYHAQWLRENSGLSLWCRIEKVSTEANANNTIKVNGADGFGFKTAIELKDDGSITFTGSKCQN
ncbi:hypothetical protein WGM54_14385 [Paenibacillus polymyxa]|uniref:hypothetical protein n=1 Tax=Paenibacillus polymyxa TaxID=1406 RepID=UPI00307FCABE